MPTWKKVIVSGSQAELAAVTASIAVLVGTNQQITSTQSTTFLTGSFTGSFKGDGSALTGVTGVSFPTTGVGTLLSTTNVFVNNGSSNVSASVAQFNSSSWAGVNGDITINGNTGAATLIKANIISSSAQISSSLFGGGTVLGGASLQLTGSSSNLSGSFSGSFQGLHTGNGSGLTNIPYTGVTFAGSGFVSQSAISSNSQGTVTASFNGVSQSVSLGLTSADTPTFNGITTNAATFPIAPSATTINLGTTTNTAINIGTNSSTVTIPGNLIVAGSTITFNTENLTVSDKFILLASGSTTNTDSGIIVSNAASNTGSAFYYDGTDTRWSVAPVAASSTTSVGANSYVVTVSGSAANPSGTPLYGSADASRIGAMYVNTTDQSIWIWS